MATKVSNLSIKNLDSTGNREIFATWSFTSPGHFSHYKVVWKYRVTKSGVAHIISESDETKKQSITSFPSNAYCVFVEVTPVSTKYAQKSSTTTKQVSYWTGTKVTKTMYASTLVPAKQSAPTCTIEKNELTMTLTNITVDNSITGIQFQIVRRTTEEGSTNQTNYTQFGNMIKCTIRDRQVSTKEVNLTDGRTYMVRCRGYNDSHNGPWSDYAGPFHSRPNPVTISSLKLVKNTDAIAARYIYIAWTNPNWDTAKQFEIQYTNVKAYFDSSDQVQSITTPDRTTEKVDNNRQIDISNFTAGVWYFRIRAINDQGNSAWSDIKSIMYGEAPGVPSTSSSKAITNSSDDVYIYWNHNPRDGSDETKAQIEYLENDTSGKAAYVFFELMYGNIPTALSSYMTSVFGGSTGSDQEDVYDNPAKFTINIDTSGDTNPLRGAFKNHISKIVVYNKGLKIVSTPFRRMNEDGETLTRVGQYLSSVGINGIKTITDLAFLVSIEDDISEVVTTYDTYITVTDDNGNNAGKFRIPTLKSHNISNWTAEGYNPKKETWYSSVSNNRGYSTRTYSTDKIIKIPSGGNLPSYLEMCPSDYYSDPEKRGYQKYLKIPANTYPNGMEIDYRVRTAGISETFASDGWSVLKHISIYPSPSLSITLLGSDKTTSLSGGNSLDSDYVINEFPFYISGNVTASSNQHPIGYSISIISEEEYYYTNTLGEHGVIPKGSSVYSLYFNSDEQLMYGVDASKVLLENNVTYTIKVIVSMSSGLTAEAQTTFTIDMEESLPFIPEAEIIYNDEDYTCAISPYLLQPIYDLNPDGSIKQRQDTDEYGSPIYNPDHTPQMSDVILRYEYTENIVLSVYRIDYDNRAVLIADGIQNGNNEFVIDPHPTLNGVNYRIIAMRTTTGATSFGDISADTECPSIIIQWDQMISNLSSRDDAEDIDSESNGYYGKILKLDYNIEVSDNFKPDVSLVEYIGNSEPVGYYGTQLGFSSSWTTKIPRYDTETLSMIRQLAIYMGDVYVREPYGTGYWANIVVSYNQSFDDLTIPITFNITRVKGGV